MLQRVTEALEHRPVPETVGVFDKRVIVAVLAGEILVDNVGNMPNASAERGIVKQINDSSGRVRNQDPYLLSPDLDRPEELFRGTHGNPERRSLDDGFSIPNVLSGYYQHRAEELICQTPVFAGCPPADIARTEGSLGYDPGILQPFPRPAGVERDGDVESVPDA